MEGKPIIKLTLNKLDKGLELAGTVFLIFMWALTLYSFQKLTSIIPTHFNGSGEVDDYGSKLTILILPVLATIIYAGITKLNNYPHLLNYSTIITDDNAALQYTYATRMLRFMKLSILLIFSMIILFIYLTTIGVTNGLGIWFLPFTFCILLLPTLILIIKSSKKKRSLK